jgi:hypothetical protein
MDASFIHKGLKHGSAIPRYDDGGYSGGSADRSALQKLCEAGHPFRLPEWDHPIIQPAPNQQ